MADSLQDMTTAELIEHTGRYIGPRGTAELVRRLEESQHDLRINARLLADQCDMPREAETHEAQYRNKLYRLMEAVDRLLRRNSTTKWIDAEMDLVSLMLVLADERIG